MLPGGTCVREERGTAWWRNFNNRQWKSVPWTSLLPWYKYLRLNKAVRTLDVCFSRLVPQCGCLQPTGQIQTHQPLLSAHLYFRRESDGKQTRWYMKSLAIRKGNWGCMLWIGGTEDWSLSERSFLGVTMYRWGSVSRRFQRS